ncbi:alpha-1,2-fucosyltransferase [Hymenobacter sp. RP-2-7]|uniref:Alpha-1,2-fucosyltransferase n=1 Tax=Hymenobacter polaris TaxID=2682546 RepID=A0A7Y0AIS4_9BACT|nr:alpha-1,2-fucosyltransferase [Hymenobacter polaris]NML68049.1 alpha-1,2-fucosyltransferase [Hymenobacter polaris]
MFQYAAGRACALRNNTELRVELSAYDRPPRGQEAARKFELPLFLGEVPTATSADLARINAFNHNRTYKAYNRGRKLLGLTPAYTYCQERVPMHFDPTILSSTGQLLYVDGDWQNEKYFTAIADELRRLFRPLGIETDAHNFQLSQELMQVNSVSLHVRRGDYINNEVHKPAPLAYYQAAIEKVKTEVASPLFYVFSDDIHWARQHLNFGEAACTFLDHNTGADSYKDLFLMSCCRHHIVANSSFSWWGAWLTSNPCKLVIAPSQWLAILQVQAADVVPDSWTIL